VSLLRERLVHLEEQFGPYGADLAEPSAELGVVFLTDGAFAEARRAFRRAMHVERINAGLYTPRQIPFLNKVIESGIAARDWRQVDNDFRYFEWLNYRIHGHEDATLIDALDRVIGWHLAAIHLDDAEEKKGDHLLRLLELGNRRLALLEKHHGTGHPRHLDQLYQLALYHYYVAVAVRKSGPVSEILLRELIGPHVYRRSVFVAQEEVAENCYRTGRQLLRRAIEAARSGPAFGQEAAGLARLYLADWDLMFNHQEWAEAGYGEAFEALAEAGIPMERLWRFFGAPALLPEPRFRLSLDPGGGGEQAGDGAISFVPWAREVPGVQFPPAHGERFPVAPADRWVLARFRVEGNGWPENIRIIAANPDDQQLSGDARNAIWHAQFRPRLDGGRVAVTRDVQARYLPPH
jgi:hypothetical protein